jgi:hypothetical protein
MQLVKAKRVTIVSERILKSEIVRMIMARGATGYTEIEAMGEGSRGTRATDWEGRNIKFETVVSEPVAHAIMQEVAEKYFEHYAVIAYVEDVEVVRGDKYMR